MTTRFCLVPDLGDTFVAALERLNDVLVALALDEQDTGVELPAELADGRALAAFERIWAAVRPTQGRLHSPRAFGRNRRRERALFTPVTVYTEDLAALGAATAALGAGVSRRDPAIENVVLEFVGSETAADVVDEITRLHGLLELAWTDAVLVLHRRFAASSACAGAGETLLTPEEEAAYRRTIDRINAMWSGGRDIDQLQY